VIPGLKYDPAHLVRIFGEQRGLGLVKFAGAVADRTFELIRRYQLNCDAEQSGWLQPAVNEQTLNIVKNRARQWRELTGVETRLVDRTEVCALTGGVKYVGGWIDPRGGGLQPLSYARELARVAKEAGARIHGGSPVTRLERRGGRWIVEANAVQISTNTVIICTNGYTGGLYPELRRSVIPATSVQVATKPLPPHLRREILPGRLPVSDARRLLNYMRYDSAGRFLFGGRGPFSLKNSERYYEDLRRAAIRMFPQLSGIEWEFSWGGRFALTSDHLPHIHRLQPGLIAGLGYNGRGVALASAVGRLLADVALGAEEEEIPLPITDVRQIPFHELRRPALETFVMWYRFLDNIGA
jgi:glycine/D-amino acid oxidase-like deaminating enzyme